MTKTACRIDLPLLLVAFLAGCSALPRIGPEHQTPEFDLPLRWSTSLSLPAPPLAAQTADLARWWRQFDDPQLDRLIETALAGNIDLATARARLRQARAAREQAEAGFFPTLSIGAQASRSKAPGATAARTFYDAGFDASWEIDLFGGTRRAVEAADADAAARKAAFDQARVSLVAEVARNHVEWLTAGRRLAVARDNLAHQDETLQIAGWRHQAGLAPATDVLQARTSREQTRAGLPELEIARAAAANRLAVLLGRPPGSAALVNDDQPAALRLPAGTFATGIPADVLTRRPDLIAAERTLAAETARLGQKQAERFPGLDLGVSFGWQAYRLQALGGAGTLARTVSGSLAAVLFDGGRRQAAVEMQAAVREQTLLAWRSAVLSALEEVENALVAHAAAHDRLEARRNAAAAAREAATLTRGLYQSGLTDFQKVLDTERTQLSAEDALASAEGSLATSLIALCKALGGGWAAGAADDGQ